MRVGTREKGKIYSQNSLLGIDRRENINESRGRVVKNMLLRDGILSKRQGISDIGYITDTSGAPLKINGIYKYGEKYIIHAGDSLFTADSLEPNGAFFDYKRTSCTLYDKQSQGFVNGGLLYLICNDELFVYDGESIASAYDNEKIYVPCTRKSIMPQGVGGAYIEGERENILTSKRKNTLVGSKEGNAKYMLDEIVDTSKEITVKCTVDASFYDNEYQAHMCGFKENKQIDHTSVGASYGIEGAELEGFFNGEGTKIDYYQIEEINIFFKNPIKASDITLYSRDQNGIPRVELRYLTEIVYNTKEVKQVSALKIPSSQLGDVIDSISIFGNDKGATLDRIILNGKEAYTGEITLTYHKPKGESSEVIPLKEARSFSGELLEVFYDDIGTKRISGNMVIGQLKGCSALISMDKLAPIRKGEGGIEITYHSANAKKPKISLGSVCKTDTGREILSLCVDDSRVAFSSSDGCFSYVPEDRVTIIGSDGERITAICQMWDFSVGIFKKNQGYLARLRDDGVELFGFLDGIGCSNINCVATVNKDTLFITEKGIFGSYSYSSQGQSLRSEAVNSIIKENQGNAYLIGFDSKLYAFLDSCVLVGDTGYKSYESSRGDSGFEYEWFVMDKEDITVATVIDNKLYFGNKNGKIRTQSRDFYDTECQGILTGDALYRDGALYFNSALNVQDKDSIVVRDCYKAVISTTYSNSQSGYMTVNPQSLVINGEAMLYEGMDIYLGKESKIKRTIRHIDYPEGYIYTDPAPELESFSEILLKCDTECLILRKSQDNFTLFDHFGAVQLIDLDISKMSIIKRKNIKCEYVSAPLYLGERSTTKNLYRIILELNPECGEIMLGYETYKTLFEKSATVGKDINFDSLSFNELAFSADRHGSVILRCYERLFDYVIFRATSETDKDFAIRGFSLCYSSSGILKGDR